MRCWKQMAVGIQSVHVPETHPGNEIQRTMELGRYLECFLPRDYMPLVVCALLDNAEMAGDQKIRVEALEIMGGILDQQGVLSNREVLEPVFPGIVSTLARIALAAQLPKSTKMLDNYKKPSSLVRSLAVKTLGVGIAAVYGAALPESAASQEVNEYDGWADRAKNEIESIVLQDSSSHGRSEEDNDGSNSDNSEEDNKRRLLQILWRLAGLRHSEYPSLVNALMDMFTSVVFGCPVLQSTPCLKVALETGLVISMLNPSGSAAAASQDFLSQLAQQFASSKGPVRKQIVAIIESSQMLFEQYIAGGSDEQRRDVLCLLAGSLRVAGQSDAKALVNSWWSARGLRALLGALNISLPGTSLLIADVNGNSEGNTKDVPYVLDGFRSAELMRALEEFVGRIAAVFSPSGLCAQLLVLLEGNGDSALHVPALWMLGQVAPMAAGSRSPAGIAQPVFEYAVDRIAAGDQTSDRTLQKCMALQAVSSVVPSVGPAVAYCMDTLLFPLLQISVSDTPLLRAQAQHSLQILSETVQSASISLMLKDNIDYIVDGCSRQLRSVELYPSVFSILSGAVKLVGSDILVYMDDVVEETLDVCEQTMDEESIALGALGFLETVSGAIAQSVGTEQMLQHEKTPVGKAEDDPVGQVLARLDEMEARSGMDTLFDIPSDDEDSNETKPADGDQLATSVENPNVSLGVELPGHPLAIKIALVVQHLLSAESSSQQLIALKIVQNIVHALINTKDLLPLLNQIWPPLVHRLSKNHDQFYVAAAACDVIDVVCELGEDWMRRRVKDDLWVHFARILRETSVSGAFTASERLLVCRVLGTLATVVQRVALDDNTSWELSCLAIRFVGNLATKNDALRLLRHMVPAYGDKIWLVLAKLGKTTIDPSTIPCLPGIPAASLAVPVDICQTLGL
ncbi:hypothetical protein FB645_000945 [Coemansia sp. IMI 203386]|nr:hypothetical protein FB645_000945 [Coemansia sp. IMI 203386]